MITQIQKWGNSQGLRLSKAILEAVPLRINDKVNITVADGKIIIEPAARVHGRFDIATLVAAIPPDYETAEVDWGAPTGMEVW
jgi:antitoxin MazE